ncbi:Toll/interleukin-1 receptor domain-containing protein, partial [Tanacetum coccineum]
SIRALVKLDTHDISDRSGCKLAKFSILPFSNSISSSTAPFDLVHSYVWGPSPVKIPAKPLWIVYSTLEQRLIRNYKNDIILPRGKSDPLKAIQESHHAVIIFSKNYADSSWCLDELVHIMKYMAENGQIVMPVFYDVDPSDVRNQSGYFGNEFFKQVPENTTKAEL